MGSQQIALNDFGKLRIDGGVIRYNIRGQDGNFVPMTCRDTHSNRMFVSWVQKFDGYSGPVEPVHVQPKG